MESITNTAKEAEETNKAPMVANSQNSAGSARKPITRTSSLTLADRLEILGDLLLSIQEAGQPVQLETVDTKDFQGVVIVLPGIDTKDGRLTPKIGVTNGGN